MEPVEASAEVPSAPGAAARRWTSTHRLIRVSMSRTRRPIAYLAPLAATLVVTCGDPVRPAVERGAQAGPSFALVAGSYRVIDLGSLLPGGVSYAYAINNPAPNGTFGTVVGGSEVTAGFGTHTGFRWTETRGIEALPPLVAGSWSWASALNDANVIVGAAGTELPYPIQHAAKWSGAASRPPSAPTDLGILPGDSIAASVAINGAGRSVGFSAHPSTGNTAVAWASNATSPTVLSLGVLPNDINDNNEFAGYLNTADGHPHAVYYSLRTGVVDIHAGWGLGGTSSNAWAISNKRMGGNDIVGWAETSTGEIHAFIWTAPAGPITDLGTATGVGNSYAYDVNNTRQVVGQSDDCGAVLWDASAGTIVALGSIASPNTCAAGSAASGINNMGQVVGSSPSAASQRRATLWY